MSRKGRGKGVEEVGGGGGGRKKERKGKNS